MTKINWEEFKEHKKHASRDDNFEILLDFMKSYYNMTSPSAMYEVLVADDLSKMMLDKRDIKDAEGLENYLFKL